MPEYNITADERPAGPHWASLNDAATHLQRILDDMPEMTALSGDDRAYEEFDSFALEVNVARWENAEPYDRQMARVRFVLGIGGPNVYLEVLCNVQGYAERVTLERYWTEHDSATTTDCRALSVVDDFVSAFIPE